jgi:hypothetical protein
LQEYNKFKLGRVWKEARAKYKWISKYRDEVDEIKKYYILVKNMVTAWTMYTNYISLPHEQITPVAVAAPAAAAPAPAAPAPAADLHLPFFDLTPVEGLPPPPQPVIGGRINRKKKIINRTKRINRTNRKRGSNKVKKKSTNRTKKKRRSKKVNKKKKY